MIRVGFVLNKSGDGWIGGVNYYRNLLGVIAASQTVQPVILTSDPAPNFITEQLPDVEVFQSELVRPSGLKHMARKISTRLFEYDLAMEWLLRRLHINVLSHSGHLGRRAKIPTICWVPDFQHLRLPEYFSAREIASRNYSYKLMIDACSRLVVSSDDAKNDLEAFRPSAVNKTRVLRFISALGSHSSEVEPRDLLLRRLKIDRPYFHLPNQFWAHKNHSVVVDALALARSRGQPLCVVATGHTHDTRNPNYFEYLMNRVRETGCEQDLKVLGLVSDHDLASLMRHAIAVINPSLFEGWSTTVEEAKSLGKTVVLSDIPVHREQAPPYGEFFDARSAESLLDCLISASRKYSPQADNERRAQALTELPARRVAFANAFEAIVQDVAK